MRGARGSEGGWPEAGQGWPQEQGEGMLYCFKVPTTSVGQGARGARGVRGRGRVRGQGSEGSKGE